MKRTLTAVVAIGALTMSACGGVDRAGTRDKFIDDIEELGGTADGDCIDAVFENFSDGEIEALSQGNTDARSQELAVELLDCTELGG